MTEIRQIITAMRESAQKAAQSCNSAYDAALKDPEFFSVEREIGAENFILGGAESGSDTAKNAETRLKDLYKKRASALKKLGLTESSIVYSPACKKCGDGGYGKDGKICACVHKRLSDGAQKNDSGLLSCGTLSEEAATASGDALKKAYAYMAEYALSFSSSKINVHLVLGKAATGKTRLCAAAAKEISKSRTVCAVTAFKMLQDFLRYINAPVAEKEFILLPYLSADLLFIDDLGSESVIKNISAELLYNTINERSLDKKHLLITSNLSPADIFDRYGERIYSRLNDKSCCKTLILAGSDLRLKNK